MSAQPATDHEVTWTIDSVGDVRGEVECKAAPGSACRLVCAEDCGADSWPCYTYEDDGTERKHTLKDGGYCNAVEWLTSSTLEDWYGGPATALRNGPVEVEFRDDSYVWRYPTDGAS